MFGGKEDCKDGIKQPSDIDKTACNLCRKNASMHEESQLASDRGQLNYHKIVNHLRARLIEKYG
eukprot:6208693-Pleurochrysis_carterae.AAC.1